jgi:hypothetical protein
MGRRGGSQFEASLGKRFRSWALWCRPVIPVIEGSTNRKTGVQVSQSIKQDPISGIANTKKAQVVEYPLPSARHSTSSTGNTQINKNNQPNKNQILFL